MDANLRFLLPFFILVAAFVIQLTASNPVIKISPKEVNLGLTKALDVECTFERGNNFTFLFSIVLLHSKAHSDDHFSHLASVSSKFGLVNGTELSHPFTTSGTVNNTGVSNVKISWLYPSQERAGVYKCEVHGHDLTGRPLTASSSESLQANLPNIYMVILEIRDLSDRFYNLKLNLSASEKYLKSELEAVLLGVNQTQSNLSNSVKKIVQEVSSVSSSVSSIQTRFASLEIQTSAIKTHQDRLKSNTQVSVRAMFISSGYYQGRRYWLTRYPSSFNPTFCQSVCMTYGGYLAEVNTHDELQFLRNFVRVNGRQFYAVMLGGTDEGHERTWIYMHSRTSVPSLWYRGQPDNLGGTEHCQSLWKDIDWELNDVVCNYTGALGFLCEIPE